MTIADEPPISQTGKKLEKSLDAVAALRKAMEQRLAEAKAAQQAAEEAAQAQQAAEEAAQAQAATPVVQEEPEIQQVAPTSEPVVAEPAPAVPELSEPATLEYVEVAPTPVEPIAVEAVETTPIEPTAPEIVLPVEPVAPEPAAAPEPVAVEEPARVEPPAAPQAPAEPAPEPKTQAAASEAAQQSETEIHFDPVEWSHIMMHVAEEGQKLVKDYIARNRDKKIDVAPFTPIPLVESLSQLSTRFLEDPEAYTNAQLATWQNYIDLTRSTLLRIQGHAVKPIAEAQANDKRFKAKDWQNNWMFDFLKQAYLSTSDEARRLVRQETTNVERKLAKKIEFYSRLFFDATAPNNFWMTNPEVLRATLDSKGENLIKGFENLLRDLESGNGTLRIRMSDYRAFQIGKNLACTPGKVVYQNDLMQLIQYSPSTPTVHSVPLLILPPWINKYYILDLKEKNSFIRYLVNQGYTVFCISWINPTKQHALTQFEDYMDKGALTAMREIKRLTGTEKLNVLGYCIGGTLLACTQAYLQAAPEKSAGLPTITSATYLVTMVDFAQPGDLGVFIDEDQISMLEDRMARQGYMDAGSMMMTFNLLRANDLIWPFVINNYLLGREPFPFDILYWNTDATNLPAAMQSYYLRKMYLTNKLVERNGIKMKDVPLDLAEISTPSFLLSTREDHIAPWKSTYAATQLYKGPVTFVLSGSGHIAGVVNPPEANKYGYWTNSTCPENPDEWLKNAESHKGSWWPEWMKWLGQYAGETIEARQITESIEEAPGSYVKVRAV